MNIEEIKEDLRGKFRSVEDKTGSFSDSARGALKPLNEGIDQAMVSIADIGKDINDLRTAPMAEGVCRHIIQEIIDFESNLPENMQAGGRLVSFASGEIFSINDIKYKNPNLIIFYGELPDGSRVRMLQHQSQLNIMLMAVPVREPDKPRRKIGFCPEAEEQ